MPTARKLLASLASVIRCRADHSWRVTATCSSALVAARGMGVAAKVIFQLLPPPTFATGDITIASRVAGLLNQVGGDVFDFALNTPTLHVAIFDAVGHGLELAAIEFLERAEATGLPSAEILRRLSRAVVDHHGGTLRDDAATVLVGWHPLLE